jgi:hypothetical protein
MTRDKQPGNGAERQTLPVMMQISFRSAQFVKSTAADRHAMNVLRASSKTGANITCGKKRRTLLPGPNNESRRAVSSSAPAALISATPRHPATNDSRAAIANAVYHATGERVRDLPITLDKLRLWQTGGPHG